jgi:hypothetical protein
MLAPVVLADMPEICTDAPLAFELSVVDIIFDDIVVVVGIEHMRDSHVQRVGFIEQSCKNVKKKKKKNRTNRMSWTYKTVCVGRQLQ